MDSCDVLNRASQKRDVGVHPTGTLRPRKPSSPFHDPNVSVISPLGTLAGPRTANSSSPPGMTAVRPDRHRAPAVTCRSFIDNRLTLHVRGRPVQFYTPLRNRDGEALRRL